MPKDQRDESKTIQRPLLITIVCIFGFIGFAMMFVALLIPSIRNLLIQRHGMIFIFLFALTFIFGIAGLIGYWKMNRWGIYLYSLMAIISFSSGFLVNVQTRLIDNLLPFVIIGIGLAYFKRMK